MDNLRNGQQGDMPHSVKCIFSSDISYSPHSWVTQWNPIDYHKRDIWHFTIELLGWHEMLVIEFTGSFNTKFNKKRCPNGHFINTFPLFSLSKLFQWTSLVNGFRYAVLKWPKQNKCIGCKSNCAQPVISQTQLIVIPRVTLEEKKGWPPNVTQELFS